MKIYYNTYRRTVYISITYYNKWSLFKHKKYICNNVKYYILSKNESYYNAIVYGINYYNIEFNKSRNIIYMLYNTEALSRWRKTNKIIDGIDKKFDVLISYKLLLSKYHFPSPYYINIDKVINDGKESIKSLDEFMKRKEAVFIYRIPYKNRNKLCDMFSIKMNVDKYGLAYKNHCKWPTNISNDKYLLIRNYKFCLAIENTINQVKWGQMHSDSIDDDYVTEKLWDCLRGGSIPIYFGAKNVIKFIPTNMTIINANDFKNYNELIEYVNSIKNDREKLGQYINWPFNYSKMWHKTMKYYSPTPCKLCNYIYKHQK